MTQAIYALQENCQVGRISGWKISRFLDFLLHYKHYVDFLSRKGVIGVSVRTLNIVDVDDSTLSLKDSDFRNHSEESSFHPSHRIEQIRGRNRKVACKTLED